ncbi:hypothetical protein CUU62_02575 [Pseudomonas sp. WP001]|nr:hypothetical protein CUU62_02575 [Pseudomonas sp. WP001]
MFGAQDKFTNIFQVTGKQCGRGHTLMPVSKAFFVGASLLAKNSQTPHSFRKYALSLTFFASKLAPTGFGASLECVLQVAAQSNQIRLQLA